MSKKKDPRLIRPAVPTVMVGLTTYRYIEQRTVQSLFNALGSCPNPATLITHSSANVWRGRNQIVDSFLNKSNCDYLLFVDADMIFHHEAIKDIIAAIQEYPDAGLMGGFYVSRDQNMRPLVGWLEEGKHYEQISFEENVARLLDSRGKIVEADLIPTGFMLIKRAVFEDMPQPYFIVDIIEREDGTVTDRSSDNVFCDKTRKAGYKTYAHMGIELDHIGNLAYSPSMLYEQLAHIDMARQFGEAKLAFIAEHGVNTQAYWNSMYGMEQAMGRVREYPILHDAVCAGLDPSWRVLDLGSGPGVLAERMDKVVTQVVCKDLSDVAINLCHQKGLDGDQFDLVNDKVPVGEIGKYDCVVSTEVLEHIEDPGAVVKKIYSFLKKDGMVIITVPDDRLPPAEEPEHVTTYTATKLAKLLAPFEEVFVEPVAGYLLGVGKKPTKPKKVT